MNLLMDKRMRPLLIIMGAFIGILLISAIFSNLGKGSTGKLNYGEIEDKIASSAESYFNENKDLLPKTLDEEVEVELSTLVNEGYMKSVDKYMKGASCLGKAKVKYTTVGYTYKGYLECGTSYTTTLFKDVLTQNVVESGNGVYKVNQYTGAGQEDVYAFRGDLVNNYVMIGEKDIWNVVKVDSTGDIMILSSRLPETYSWDDRYNIETDDYNGINNFHVSRIKDTLLKLSTSVDQYPRLKKMINAKTVCLGSRGESTIGNSGAIECSKTIDNQYFSLLPVYDFLTASLDENCNSTSDVSCSNYNYLNDGKSSWWSLTTSSLKSNRVYYFEPAYASAGFAKTTRRIRVVAYLDNDTVYVSGTGTQEDPYIIK